MLGIRKMAVILGERVQGMQEVICCSVHAHGLFSCIHCVCWLCDEQDCNGKSWVMLMQDGAT